MGRDHPRMYDHSISLKNVLDESWHPFWNLQFLMAKLTIPLSWLGVIHSQRKVYSNPTNPRPSKKSEISEPRSHKRKIQTRVGAHSATNTFEGSPKPESQRSSQKNLTYSFSEPCKGPVIQRNCRATCSRKARSEKLPRRMRTKSTAS